MVEGTGVKKAIRKTRSQTVLGSYWIVITSNPGGGVSRISKLRVQDCWITNDVLVGYFIVSIIIIVGYGDENPIKSITLYNRNTYSSTQKLFFRCFRSRSSKHESANKVEKLYCGVLTVVFVTLQYCGLYRFLIFTAVQCRELSR